MPIPGRLRALQFVRTSKPTVGTAADEDWGVVDVVRSTNDDGQGGRRGWSGHWREGAEEVFASGKGERSLIALAILIPCWIQQLQVAAMSYKLVGTFWNQLEATEPAETNWTTSSLKQFESLGI